MKAGVHEFTITARGASGGRAVPVPICRGWLHVPSLAAIVSSMVVIRPRDFERGLPIEIRARCAVKILEIHDESGVTTITPDGIGNVSDGIRFRIVPKSLPRGQPVESVVKVRLLIAEDNEPLSIHASLIILPGTGAGQP